MDPLEIDTSYGISPAQRGEDIFPEQTDMLLSALNEQYRQALLETETERLKKTNSNNGHGSQNGSHHGSAHGSKPGSVNGSFHGNGNGHTRSAPGSHHCSLSRANTLRRQSSSRENIFLQDMDGSHRGSTHISKPGSVNGSHHGNGNEHTRNASGSHHGSLSRANTLSRQSSAHESIFLQDMDGSRHGSTHGSKPGSANGSHNGNGHTQSAPGSHHGAVSRANTLSRQSSAHENIFLQDVDGSHQGSAHGSKPGSFSESCHGNNNECTQSVPGSHRGFCSRANTSSRQSSVQEENIFFQDMDRQQLTEQKPPVSTRQNSLASLNSKKSDDDDYNNALAKQNSVNGVVRQSSDKILVRQNSVTSSVNGLVCRGSVNCSDNGALMHSSVNGASNGLVRQNSNNGLVRQSSFHGSNSGLMGQNSACNNGKPIQSSNKGLVRQGSFSGSVNDLMRQSSVDGSNNGLFNGSNNGLMSQNSNNCAVKQTSANGSDNGLVGQGSIYGSNKGLARQESFDGLDLNTRQNPAMTAYNLQQQQRLDPENHFSVIALADEDFVYSPNLMGEALLDYSDLPVPAPAGLNQEIARSDNFFSSRNKTVDNGVSRKHGVDRVDRRTSNENIYKGNGLIDKKETCIPVENLNGRVVDINGRIVSIGQSDDVYELLNPVQTVSETGINYSQSDTNSSSAKNGRKKESAIKHQQAMNGMSNNKGKYSESSQNENKNGSINGRRGSKNGQNGSQSNNQSSRREEFEQVLLARENSFRIHTGQEEGRKLVKQRSKAELYQMDDTDQHYDVSKIQISREDFCHGENIGEMCYSENGQIQYRQFKDYSENGSQVRKTKSSNGSKNGKSKNGKNGRVTFKENEHAMQIDSSAIRKIIETEKNSTENDIDNFSFSESERFEPYVRLHGNIDVKVDSGSYGSKSGTFKGEFSTNQESANKKDSENYRPKNERHIQYDCKGLIDPDRISKSVQKPGMEYWVYSASDHNSRSFKGHESVKEVQKSQSYSSQKTNNLVSEGHYEMEKLKKSELKQGFNKNENDDVNYGKLDIMFKHVHNDQFKMVMVSDELNNERQLNERNRDKDGENVRYINAKQDIEQMEARIYYLGNKEQAGVYLCTKIYSVKLQWLLRLWDHGNLSEISWFEPLRVNHKARSGSNWR